MQLVKIRNYIRLFASILFCFIYIPHLTIYLILGFTGNRRSIINTDLRTRTKAIKFNLPVFLSLLYNLHNDSYFRSLFYYRIGSIPSALISWIRPSSKIFTISYRTKIGSNFNFFHPYATVINAESIGDCFSIAQCSTIGASHKGKPIIGNNVKLGAHVVIIGNVIIGDNVTIGAGSVVVKDIPSNSIAVGNPAKVIKTI